MRKIISRISIIIFVFLVVFICNSKAYAEKLTLEQSIDIAIKNNNTFKSALLKVEENRYKVREAWGMLWPSLSTDVSYTRQDYEAGYMSSIAGQYNINIVSGKISINPGTFYHSLLASRNSFIAAEHEVRKIKSEIIINTIQLYFQILLTEELIKMHKESLKALEENLRVITVGYKKGTFSKLDYLRAKVAYSNQKTQLINAQNDYLTACAYFNIHLNRDINTPVDLDDSILNVSNDELTFLELSSEKRNELTVKLVGIALKNRPELLQIRYTKEALKHSKKAISSLYLWPSFFVSGNYSTSKSISSGGSREIQLTGNPSIDPILIAMNESMSETFAPEGWNKNWSITIGATYNWGGWSPLDSNHAKANQIEKQSEQIDLQLKDFIKSVKLDIQRGILKLLSASNSLKSQKDNILTAEESMKVARKQFRNGIIDNSKFLETNVGLIQAKTMYIQALYNYKIAEAELNKAIGIDYFEIK